MNVGIAGVNSFQEGVMNENVLLFGLDEEIALIADVTQKSPNVQFVLALNLLQHGVQNDVRSYKK